MNEDIASTLRLLDEALARYIRPDTFPLAIRMLKPGEAIPEDVKVPSKAMGQQWIVCQSIGVARRYGWGIAVGKDDLICPLATIAFGFRKPNEEYLRGFVSVGMYCKDEQAAANLEASTWRFEPGTFDYVCVAPTACPAWGRGRYRVPPRRGGGVPHPDDNDQDLASCGAAALVAIPASAARFSYKPVANGGYVYSYVYISGEIESADDDAFLAYVKPLKNEKILVVLDSPGGEVGAGLISGCISDDKAGAHPFRQEVNAPPCVGLFGLPAARAMSAQRLT